MVSHYNNDISWIPAYADSYLIYDQSEVKKYPKEIDKNKVIPTRHLGHNIYDYCSFIIDHYENLPEITLFATGNIFPRHVSEYYFKKIMNNDFFTPIEEYKRHYENWPISFFSSDGGFCEINNSWYLAHHPTKYFHDYNHFLEFCFKNPVIPRYIRFAPGANYIVPKAHILKFPKIFYQNLKLFVSHCETAIPGESHIIERALHTIWTSNFDINENMLKPIDESFIARAGAKYRINLKDSFFHKIKVNATKLINNIQNVDDQKANTISMDVFSQVKKAKIFDIFTFFNELELLELRLAILNDYVDEFVIVEATETFSGKPKKLFYAEHKNKFKRYHSKIRHYIIDTVPTDEADFLKKLNARNTNELERRIIRDALSSDNVPKGQLHWLKEFYQKESIKKAITNLRDDDICFVSDVDEIWNPEVRVDLSRDDIYKLRQLVYIYYLNNRSNEPWAGTLVTKYKNIKNNCLNHLRTKSKTKYTYINNGGWHFSFQGGEERIKTKLESYGHQEFNTEEVKKGISKKIKNNEDFVGRKFKFWVDESDLPRYILENKEKYQSFFK